jgi:hypothetical protein
MKKILLTGAMLMALSFSVNAQQVTYNFEDLTLGNIGTDVTGATDGQGGWYFSASNGQTNPTTTNLGVETFQIINNADDHGNVLQVTGPDGTSGGAYMWHEGATDVWTDRTDGNNVYNVTFDYYTGTPSASANAMQVQLYNEGYSKYIAGFLIDTSTLEIFGIADLPNTPATAPASLIRLGEAVPVLPEETWVRLSFSFNYEDGLVTFQGKDADGTDLFAGTVEGASIEVDPFELDFAAESFSDDNDEAAIGIFDNLKVEVAEDVIELSTKNIANSAKFAVYPNPTSNVVNVNSNDALVNAVNFTDLNGRIVKSAKFNGAADAQINISDLASGVYMMNISSDKGTTVKKIVKN